MCDKKWWAMRVRHPFAAGLKALNKNGWCRSSFWEVKSAEKVYQGQRIV